jgi:FtsH-binding integral membrane protein
MRHRHRKRNPMSASTRKILLFAAVAAGGYMAYALWKASQTATVASTTGLTAAQVGANAAASIAPATGLTVNLQPISLSGQRLH